MQKTSYHRMYTKNRAFVLGRHKRKEVKTINLRVPESECHVTGEHDIRVGYGDVRCAACGGVAELSSACQEQERSE